ncbi:uncharacterized protein AB675_560 [Cyphellophora attinorum]|uniref:Heterokaryon incompatibility domain-containing protein n=1 Tax=Cyphellophora attinorum TaxID=1664694 RepID=A0A0N1I146_9EURO|nr:uncharacterized protein AB675_560 [Phialophora attinorum]KPI45460.1 hypothetical protein AB675_560 [Phialophora attinorum]
MSAGLSASDNPPNEVSDMTALSPTYSYSVIPPQGWIRVVKLHADSDILSCDIHVQQIDDKALQYEALSYVWGEDDTNSSAIIHCNGRPKSIGSNLAAALKHLRYSDRARILWADALSINQSDSEEKSLQVAQMGQIYAAAERVVVWLGMDSEEEAAECFGLIQSTTRTLDLMVNQHGSIEDVPPLPTKNAPIASGTDSWTPVSKLMQNPYFERTWTLSETGLAKTAIIQWGLATMPWSCLVELMLLIALRPDIRAHTGILNSGLIWDTFEDLWSAYRNSTTWRDELPYTRSFPRSESGISFISTLNNGRYYRATDARDHIYAFLSHPSADAAASDNLLVPDYEKSVDQIYLETALRVLETDSHPWTLLSCIDHTIESPSLKGGRPSWVPRWNEQFRVYWLGYPGMWYRAGNLDGSRFVCRYDGETQSLHLRGIVLDTVSWASSPHLSADIVVEEQLKEQPIQCLWHELAQHEGSAQRSIYGADQRARECAFSLVTIAGRSVDESPAENDVEHHLTVWNAYKAFVSGKTSAAADGFLNHEVHRLIDNQRRALDNRRLFCTEQGYYGVAHRTLRQGDVCCVLKGAGVPFILRRVDASDGLGGSKFILVGEAYIQGIMRGEFWDAAKDQDLGITVI